MILSHADHLTDGTFSLIYNETSFSNSFSTEKHSTLTIVWNTGDPQLVQVDTKSLKLKCNEIMVLTANQSYKFDQPETIVAWQFNRDFYCIIDHDHEVSCAGLLFYGSRGIPTLELNEKDQKILDVLFQVFLDEFNEDNDNLKTEMLRAMLKRLVVKLTRWYKIQNVPTELNDQEMDVVRHFNLLVEQHFKKYHQVQDYADLIHKSSKTISNLFSKYSKKSPLQTIHERIVLEAKRLLIFTDKSTKEIAYEIGFQDIPGFSRFFKKHTQMTPSDFRKKQ